MTDPACPPLIFSVIHTRDGVRAMDSSDNSSVSYNLSDCNYDEWNSESDISMLTMRTFLVVMEAMIGEDDDLNSSGQEKLYWCKCTHCTVMPTFIECRFCRECFTVYSMTNMKI